MSENLFREKSLKRIQTPDRLNDTIKVVNPAIWILLAAVILLLAGGLCWAALGTIDVTASGEATVSAGYVSLAVADGPDVTLRGGMHVLIDTGAELRMEITMPANARVYLDESLEMAVFDADAELPDGTWPAVVILEEIRPISFLLN